MSYFPSTQITDSSGNAAAIVDNKMRVINNTYGQAMAEGLISGHTLWTKIGYTPTMNATESDIWSKAGVYAFPTAASKWEIVSSDATNQDKAVVIKGDATGDTYTTTGGSTTTIEDTAHGATYFNDATQVAAGDCIILDPHGSSPEWGYVTTVANQILTCSGGFSSGGSGSGRKYAVIDKSATTNARVFKIEYLDSSYAPHTEIVALTSNGNTATDTVNTDYFRVQSFRILATGSNNKALGNISLNIDGGATTYSYITLGFTRSRNICYTVPAGKTLYVVQVSMAYATTGNANKEYARLYTRANLEPTTVFHTGSLFYSYSEICCQNMTTVIELYNPTKLTEKTDIKVSGVASSAGVATCVLRGWLE